MLTLQDNFVIEKIMIEDITLRVRPEESADPRRLVEMACRRLGISPKRVNDSAVVRRSIDARQRAVAVNITLRLAIDEATTVMPDFRPPCYRDVADSPRSVVIVGAGPAGLFAALRALELGIRPVVIERGDDVDTRRKKLAAISREGTVDPDCNYSFGEGGAGAYSDGKLFTRSKKRGDVTGILSTFHHHGASQDILIDSHPHIGSDRLPGIIRSMREAIIAHGGEVRFRTKMTGLIIEDGAATGVTLDSGERIEGDGVIIATGHSARDVYRMLRDGNVAIEAKGLAIGVRLEHPQGLIDRLQYHSKEGRGKYLPAAEYSFVAQADGRGVYSFCMCPGGVIVPAATAPGESVVNGMSASARGSRWANSGMVVEIHPGDFPEYASHGPLEMMALQEDLERKFYEASGNSLNAPAQRMTDFVASRPSRSLPDSSFPPGIHPARVDLLLPPFISKRLQQGFKAFDRRCRGFLTPEATVIGLESRTSSPVRIPRDRERMEHIEIRRLYPAGEGAGYAGGIASAAMDGIKCIEALNEALANQIT